VCCLGIIGHADEAGLSAICDTFQPVGVAKLGRQIRCFQREGVTEATMAGKVFKTWLFQRALWNGNIPDWTCMRTFFPHFVTKTKKRNDDSLLLAVIEAYARGGITFAPATNFAPELLVNTSHLGGPQLSFGQRKDIAFGFGLAKEMGRLDIGQSVVVKGQAVLAVEAIEGTDECIRRAGQLCPAGGFTVVKVAKPQQDMRFDVPTIGVGTLEVLAAAGAKVLAIESGKTIVIDRNQVAAFAAKHRISVVAVDEASLQDALHAA
jgi:DUF1009 family protein